MGCSTPSCLHETIYVFSLYERTVLLETMQSKFVKIDGTITQFSLTVNIELNAKHLYVLLIQTTISSAPSCVKLTFSKIILLFDCNPASSLWNQRKLVKNSWRSKLQHLPSSKETHQKSWRQKQNIDSGRQGGCCDIDGSSVSTVEEMSVKQHARRRIVSKFRYCL